MICVCLSLTISYKFMIIFWIFPITIVNSHCECIYFVIMFHCVSPSKVEQNSLRSILKIPNMSVKNVMLTILPIICNIMMKYCMLGNNKISLFVVRKLLVDLVWCDVNCWSCHHHSWGSTIYNPLEQSLFSVNLQHNTYTSRETRRVSGQDILFIQHSRK